MVFVPLLAAPTLMLAATAAERRFGPAVAGAMAAMPVALSIIVLAVGAELGRDAGATLAAGAAAHVTAQVAFALVFAAVLTRRGPALGLLAGASAFVAISLLVAPIPPLLAILAGVPALLLGSARIKGSDPSTRRSYENPCSERNRIVEGSDPLVSGLGAVAAFVMVGASLVTADLAGPGAAGTIGAFPALSTALALVLARSRGVEAAAGALRGLVGGLRAYLVFCVTVAVVAPAFGVIVAVPLALAGCAAAYAVLLGSVPRRPACAIGASG
jgi:hypothetical protein